MTRRQNRKSREVSGSGQPPEGMGHSLGLPGIQRVTIRQQGFWVSSAPHTCIPKHQLQGLGLLQDPAVCLEIQPDLVPGHGLDIKLDSYDIVTIKVHKKRCRDLGWDSNVAEKDPERFPSTKPNEQVGDGAEGMAGGKTFVV